MHIGHLRPVTWPRRTTPATASPTSSRSSIQGRLGSSLILQIKFQSPGQILGPVPLHILWRLFKVLRKNRSGSLGGKETVPIGTALLPVTKGPNAYNESFLGLWVPAMSSVQISPTRLLIAGLGLPASLGVEETFGTSEITLTKHATEDFS